MTTDWCSAGLLRDLRARGTHVALVIMGTRGPKRIGSERLAAMIISGMEKLRSAGVGPGDRILLRGPNGLPWIVAALAVLSTGGVLIPVDYQLEPGQFASAVQRSAARFAILPATLRFGETASPGSITTVPLEIVGAETTDALAVEVGQSAAPDALAMLSWTSGTTGSPKIVTLTMANLAASVDAIVRPGLVGEQDRAVLLSIAN